MKIDLNAIIRSRLSRKANFWIPTWMIRILERIVRQNELNGILERTYPAKGVAFASAALKDLNITISTCGMENIPSAGRYIFASNHPLGGLDGIALIKVLGEKYGEGNILFPVNDMLLNVKPLDNVFVGINKYGHMGRRASTALNDAYASDAQVLFFPAGLVSRKGKDGEIRDLEWKKGFVAKAIEHGRGIIPLKFEGLNSGRFYNIARLRKRLGLKINIEQALLPSELCRSKGTAYTIKFGKPISHSELAASGKPTTEIAATIREMVYSL